MNLRSVCLAAMGLAASILMPAGAARAVDPAMEDYTAYPVFIQASVKPSVLIILDNSGSMNFMAYGYHEDGAYHPDDFGNVKDGIADAEGGASSLIDQDADFLEELAAYLDGSGNPTETLVLHNIDDGATGTITGVSQHMLAIAGGMSGEAENNAGERYWVEAQSVKDPDTVEAGYYGYFVPNARYHYASNVFWRDDAGGEWSGSFLNWLTMRRVDVARKVLMGGLATSRTGTGNQHLIGESPAQSYRKFLKIIPDPTGYTPYDSRHFYKIAGGYIEVYKIDDGEPDLDYARDFTVQSITSSGDDHTLTGYVFDYIGSDTYEIRWRQPVLSGTADGLVDRNGDGTIDDRSSYRYYLYDPSEAFVGLVGPGDFFQNDSEGSTGYVSAVPQSVDELLSALPAEILYDMFHDDEDGYDGHVKCIHDCNPDVSYLPCQDDVDFAACQSDGDLGSELAPLIGHLVIFATPLDPWGPNSGESYHFERTIRATQVARLKIEVDRNQDDPDEARDFVDGNLAGVLQKIGDRARFGLEFYNYEQGGDVVQYVGSNMTDLINRIENRGANTWTPLAESLYEGIRYFQQASPYYASGDYTTNDTWDPFYFNDLHQFVSCSKAFVLQITDGESTQDQDIPETYRDYDADGNDPGSYPSNGSDYLDDVALWAHTTDLRPDLPDDLGPQNLTYYTVFAFGRGSTLLQDAAKNGGFWDLNGDGLPGPASREWDRDQDGVPDTYFEAPSGFVLERRIFDAITAILKRAASGTAVSVLSTSERGEGSMYQAFFRPRMTEGLDEIKWLGYLQSFWLDRKGNIREDTVADGRLVLTEDKIIRYRFDETNLQTIVDRFSDADGDMAIDHLDAQGNPVPDDSFLLEDYTGAVWEAGKKLALRNPDTRTIFTFADSDFDGVADSTEQIDFDTAMTGQLGPFLQVIGENPSSYSYLGDEAQRAETLIRFIRGEQIDGLRDRRVTVDGAKRVWKLGDIVFSTPTVAGSPQDAYEKIYGDQSYFHFIQTWRERTGMVYIGANDGMLHAFRSGRFVEGDDPSTGNKQEAAYISGNDLGSEAWAYIPFNLLPHLKWLADPDYTHVFFVDQKMKVADVRIFPHDGTHVEGWGTLLIGALRLGGGPYPSNLTGPGGDPVTFRSAYFLIDVTDPESPRVLAEITHPQMGFTTSYPTVAKVQDHWYVIMGSGPTPGSSPPYRYDGTSDQKARIFVLDLTEFMASGQIREGQELFVIQGVDNEAFMGDPMSVDMPLDYSVDAVYIGETYWQSNRWNGRMYRLRTTGATDPSSWQLFTLFNTQAHQAVTAAPSAAVGFGGDLWIYFGTGRFYDDQDKVDDHIQSFYGIHDRCLEGGSCGEVPASSLLDVTGARVYTDRSVSGLSEAGTFSELEAGFTGNSPSYLGWKMDLTGSGERSLSKPRVIGGTVLFTTFLPDSDICSMGGEGNLYALYFLTGTAHYNPIIGEDDTLESLKSTSLGKGLPASLGVHVGTREGATGFIQTSTGNIVQLNVMPPLRFKSGTISWRQP